jgi:hypothetical protein
MPITIDGTNGISDVRSTTDGSAATPAIRGTDTNTGIFFPAADTIAFSEGGTEAMRIDGSGNLGIGTTSPYAVGGSWKMLNVGIGGIQGGIAATNSTLLVQNCYYNGSSWQRASTGATGYIDVGGGNIAFSNDASGSAGTFTPTERMRIDSSGNLLVGVTSQLYGERLNVTRGGVGNNVATFYFDTSDDRGAVIVRHAGASGATSRTQIAFLDSGGTERGRITSNGSATSYVTSSDYRLKENIAPMTGALATVSALKPVTYKWKADGSDGQGFIAHELQEVVPDCVTGEKDAVDEEGNIKPQGIDTSFLVATLTAAIQELKSTVDAQAARIAALENPPVESATNE